MESPSGNGEVNTLVTDGIHRPPEGYDGCPLCECHFRSIKTQEEGRGDNDRYKFECTDEQASELIQSLRADAERDREYIRERLVTHGDLILSRWTKKSKEKRAVLLSTCENVVFGPWPRPSNQEMCNQLASMQLGPDDERIRAAADPRWLQNRYSVVCFALAEWLKLEDLMDDRMKLLSLLHVRTAFTPAEWTLFDTRKSMSHFSSGRIPAVFNVNSVKMYGEEYGTLTQWDHDRAYHCVILGFPRAICTFMAQQAIMGVLRNLVDTIVDHAPPSGTTKWTGLVNGGFRSSPNEALWGSYTNEAFAPPQPFDLHVMLRKAKTRLDLVQDELELMQTDPAYMHHVIRQMKAAVVFDDTSRVRTDMRYQQLALDLIIHDIRTRLDTWRNVVKEIGATIRAFQEHRKPIVPGVPLPPELDVPLCSIGGILESRKQKLGLFFDSLLPRMTTFRDRFTHYQDGDTVRYLEKQTMDPNNPTDRVYRSLKRARLALKNGSLYGASRWFDQLEREMLTASPAVQIDKRFYDHLSELATLDELQSMWMYSGMCNTEVDLEVLQAYWDTAYPGPRQVAKAPTLDLRDLQRLGSCIRIFSQTPWPRIQNDVASMEKASACRGKLSALWDSVREVLRSLKVQAGTRKDVIDDWIDCFTYDQQPEYLAEVEQERLKYEAARTATGAVCTRSLHIDTEPQTEWGGGSTSDSPVFRRRTKTKAAQRAAEELDSESPQVNGSQSEIAESDLELPKEATPILVKQDSLIVFQRMFPQTGASVAQGAVRWVQFVQAMNDAGFTATAVSGSAVNFGNDTHGSIAFHKPHPEPTIEPITLHWWAKRMRKRFGWCRERFVIREKQT